MDGETDVSQTRGTIAVIGGGVVGAATALRLQMAGWSVTMYEPNEPGSGCSMGNSGHIGIASIIPWASPSIVKHSFSMLMDPLHPLHVSPRGWIENANWFTSFIAAARPPAVAHGTEVLAQIFSTAWQDASALIDAAEANSLISDRGILQVYSSEKTFAGSRGGDAIRRRKGIEIVELSTAELHELEPALGPLAVRGTLFPGVMHVLDPQGLPQHFVASILKRGGHHVPRPVQAIILGDRPAVVVDGAQVVYDKIIVAAGFGSRKFFKDLGVTVPLAGERGYHIQMTGQRDLISRAISYIDGRVGISPMLGGLRLTSGADFCHPASPVRYERARRIFENARALFPSLGELKGREWCDARPSTPDSLPIIGLSPRNRNVILAAGHGHVGLGLSGVTARLVEALLDGRDAGVNFAAIAPNRKIGAQFAKTAA